ncbi:MAG: DNA polymerase III subunit delta [bacterium]
MILYLYGENSYAISRQLSLIKSQYIKKTGSEGDMQSIDALEQGNDSLLANLSAMPMFVSSRLIILTNLPKSKPSQAQIDAILQNATDSTNLVIIDPNPDKRTTLYKSLSKVKGATEFRRLSRVELTKWALVEAHRAGAKLDSQLAGYLIDLVGENQWSLHNEISKLASYDSDISRDSIDELATPSLENNAFILAEALVRKDLPRVIKLYKNLKLQGYADQMILGAIIYQFRVLMLVIINNPQLNQAYKVSPYSTQKALPLVKALDIEDISRAYQLIAEADIATKTGELSSEEAMNGLFYKLCNQEYSSKN